MEEDGAGRKEQAGGRPASSIIDRVQVSTCAGVLVDFHRNAVGVLRRKACLSFDHDRKPGAYYVYIIYRCIADVLYFVGSAPGKYLLMAGYAEDGIDLYQFGIHKLYLDLVLGGATE